MKYPMFRNIFRIMRSVTLGAAVAATVAGCSEDIIEIEKPDMPESGYINIALNCSEGTRAEGDKYTEDSNESLNENLISSVILCLWAKDGTKPDDNATPDYVQVFTGLNKTQTATLKVPITQPLLHKLFETGAECHAFVAVNVPMPDGEFTIKDLRDMAITSEFSSRRTQPSFAMDGDCVVTYDKNLNIATGNIDLLRSASKITLALSVDQEVSQTVVIDGKTVTSKWKPNLGEMRVSLVGGLAESTLDPKLEDTPKEAAFFNTPDHLVYKFTADNKDNGNNPSEIPNSDPKETYTYPYIQERPFYTYPHRWSAEPGDYAATYMMLSIPWQEVGDDGEPVNDSWRTCYYQVPAIAADSDLLQLVRNISYHVYLHVGLLGSFIPDEPLLLEDLKYSAAPWGTVNMDVNIPDVRYLVVDQNDYTVNNENSITIPFYTSHETVVTDATMTFYRYNYTDAGLKKTVTVSMAQNEESAKANRAGAPVFTAKFNNSTKELTVSHDIKIYEAYDAANQLISFTDNDGPDVTAADRRPNKESTWQTNVLNKISYFKKKVPEEDEYTEIYFTITLQHKDMTGTPNFKEVITISQYPGMYISAIENYHGPANATSFNFTGAQGNTGINGNYTTAYSNAWNYEHMPSLKQSNGWTTTIGLNSNNYNYNPNMYLVTVTTLPQGTDYIIGDPRSNYINNDLRSSQSGGINSLPTLPSNLNNMTAQNTYTRQLITTGVNSSLPTTENKTVWTSQTYYWNYWNLNNGSWRILASSNYGGPNYPITVTGFKEHDAIYTEGTSKRRNLTYYYPTQEDNAHKMTIAPKFRICSSYAGTTWQLNRELARRRAAAYQEMGYAAGRWRLPTFGEVKFIMELAASYKIPRLFGTAEATWWYWCAQGLVCVPAKNVGVKSPTLPSDADFELPIKTGARDCHRARFVYDEWYWGEADLKANGPIGSANPVYTFTWGDKPF